VATVEGVAYASVCFALAALFSVRTWALKTGRLKKWRMMRNDYASGSRRFGRDPAYALACALMGFAFLAALLPGKWVLLAPLLLAVAFVSGVVGAISVGIDTRYSGGSKRIRSDGRSRRSTGLPLPPQCFVSHADDEAARRGVVGLADGLRRLARLLGRVVRFGGVGLLGATFHGLSTAARVSRIRDICRNEKRAVSSAFSDGRTWDRTRDLPRVKRALSR
jgi:hypothetical protein